MFGLCIADLKVKVHPNLMTRWDLDCVKPAEANVLACSIKIDTGLQSVSEMEIAVTHYVDQQGAQGRHPSSSDCENCFKSISLG